MFRQTHYYTHYFDGKLYPAEPEKKKKDEKDLFGDTDKYYPLQVKHMIIFMKKNRIFSHTQKGEDPVFDSASVILLMPFF
ncbi:MAG: hypothetical protein NTV87_12245 [Ignavibacteriae bacterium]|nr:hypothetical protein [Ignavibacteriota bacterium]